MRNFLRLLLLAPLVVIFLTFDMANRQNVLISFDPFNSSDPALPQVSVPLFIVLIGAIMLGVLLGGVATWFGQSRFRREARQANAKAENLRRENETLRGQIKTLKGSGSAVATVPPARNAA